MADVDYKMPESDYKSLLALRFKPRPFDQVFEIYSEDLQKRKL